MVENMLGDVISDDDVEGLYVANDTDNLDLSTLL